jgi:adenylate cyclase
LKFMRRSVPDWVIALSLVALLSVAAVLPGSERLDAWAFDTLSTMSSPVPDAPGAVIVAIDEPSMAALGEQWPWPRSRHAELVEALRKAGAKAIALDIVFAETSQPTDDAALKAAGGRDLVMAADDSIIERSFGTTRVVTEPAPEVLGKGTRLGIASLSADGDGALRRMPRYPDSFVAELLRAAGAEPDIAGRGGDLIQYFGPAGSYPTVSYYQALDPEAFLPRDYFRDQVVIVGFALQAGPEVQSGGVDAFVTPYTARTQMLTSGVEVQATIFDNFRTGMTIRPAPRWVAILLAALGGLLALASARPRKLILRFIGAIGLLALVFMASWLAVRFGRIWLSPIAPSAALALVTLGISARDFAAERRQRREVQSAFGQYVSPAVVERLIANPELLNLGGERRELTIMFADIRGFTTICEAMKDDPVGLTTLINDILTPLSEIVMERGGTIDKYMGDCIMAFWNAPLDDADHALHAVEAAEAMLAAMPEVNNAIASRLPYRADGAHVRIGIGINSGECVIGNMGSAKRFDYSVLGDAVNIAARLESLCKTYDVPVIIGNDTVERIGKNLAFRQLDEIAVRGRSETQAIFTLG